MFNTDSYKLASSLVDLFELPSRKYGMDTMFSDWISIMICCFARQTREDDYFEIIKRYEKDELNFFAQALAKLIEGYDNVLKTENWTDILGHCQEILTSGRHKSQFGEFFTPNHLCDLLAGLQIEDSTKTGLKISDPACGSGRTLLAAAFTYDSPRENVYFGADIQLRACQMAAINMLMHNLEGMILQQNSLSLEITRGFYIHRFPLPWIECFDSSQANRFHDYFEHRAEQKKLLVKLKDQTSQVGVTQGQLF